MSSTSIRALPRLPLFASATLLLLALSPGGCAGVTGSGAVGAAAVTELASACTTLLAALPDERRAEAVHELADDEVLAWHFVPGRYAGVEIGKLDPTQQVLVHDVVRAMLGAKGYAKTRAIMQLEDLLRERESTPEKVATHRDSGRYSLLIAGDPAARNGTFVVRFQGHHVSLRIAVVDGMLASFSPHFLGTNPHRVVDLASGEPAESWWRVLGREEDLGRALWNTLDEAQQRLARLPGAAPPDVLLGPAVMLAGGGRPDELGDGHGIRASELRPDQRRLFWGLVEEYAQRLRGPIATAELQRMRAEGLEQLRFAWAGSAEPMQGHYYRVVGSFFAIEYDCTQNNANHVHTVWRDFERDFGGDPLRDHLRDHHSGAPGR